MRLSSSLVRLTSAIAKGEVENGFSIMRPPGHHAEQVRSCDEALLAHNYRTAISDSSPSPIILPDLQ